MDFFSVIDQFFFNFVMVYCKVVMDVGVMICVGSIVMVMICNGNMFGIWVSGLGECWFIVFVNIL